jgi:two-component system phosphate regulon sensor histidine kinase PhoR
LVSAVSNLVNNAIRYTPLGGEIHLHWSLTAEGAVFVVKDTGPGIAAEHLPRLSERFYRVEETATGKSGTGLGLAIVKHIVNRHRGGLVVESEQGRGTAFSVYLPQPLELGPVRTIAEVQAG